MFFGPEGIYIDASRPTNAVAATLAHEVLGHTNFADVAGGLEYFARTNPEVQVKGEALARSYGEPEGLNMREEGTAYILETVFADPKIQEQLAQSNPGLAGYLANAARTVVDDIAGTNLNKAKVVERQLKMLDPLFKAANEKVSGGIDVPEPMVEHPEPTVQSSPEPAAPAVGDSAAPAVRPAVEPQPQQTVEPMRQPEPAPAPTQEPVQPQQSTATYTREQMRRMGKEDLLAHATSLGLEPDVRSRLIPKVLEAQEQRAANARQAEPVEAPAPRPAETIQQPEPQQTSSPEPVQPVRQAEPPAPPKVRGKVSTEQMLRLDKSDFLRMVEYHHDGAGVTIKMPDGQIVKAPFIGRPMSELGDYARQWALWELDGKRFDMGRAAESRPETAPPEVAPAPESVAPRTEPRPAPEPSSTQGMGQRSLLDIAKMSDDEYMAATRITYSGKRATIQTPDGNSFSIELPRSTPAELQDQARSAALGFRDNLRKFPLKGKTPTVRTVSVEADAPASQPRALPAPEPVAPRVEPQPTRQPDVRITGKELGENLDFREMRKQAYRYARDNFLGKTVRAKSDGMEIDIPSRGIGKSISGQRKPEELQATVAIPQMLEHSVETRPTRPDQGANPDIKAVHYRDVDVNIGGELRHFVMVVKETRQGNKFYDRYIEQKKAQPVKLEGSSIARSLPDSKAAAPQENTIAPTRPNVKENPDTQFSRRDPAERRETPKGEGDSLHHPYEVGRIDTDVARAAGMKAGGIRLEPNSIRHMETPERLKQLKKAGFDSAKEAVDYVASGYQRVYSGKGDSLLLVRSNGKDMATYIQLIPDEVEQYYRVNTVLPLRSTFLKSKPLLWERAPTSQTPEGSPPSAISGQSKGSKDTIAPTRPDVKENPDTQFSRRSPAEIAAQRQREQAAPQQRESSPKDATESTVGRVVKSYARAFGDKHPDAAAKLSEGWENARRAIEDEFRPIRKRIADLKKQDGNISDESDTGLQLDLHRGRAEHEMEQIKRAEVEPLVETMTRGQLDQKLLDLYSIAMHAEERNTTVAQRNPNDPSMADGGSGMSNAQARKIIQEVRSSPKAAMYEKARQHLLNINQKALKIKLDGGLIKKENYDLLTQRWQNYVPLKTDVKSDRQGGMRIGRGFDIGGKEYQVAMGRKSIADSPTVFSLMQAQEAIVRAEKNKVKQSRIYSRHEIETSSRVANFFLTLLFFMLTVYTEVGWQVVACWMV